MRRRLRFQVRLLTVLVGANTLACFVGLYATRSPFVFKFNCAPDCFVECEDPRGDIHYISDGVFTINDNNTLVTL
jgi:hypothetical protein